MAELYAAPIPHCPVHGQMHHDPTRELWSCKGFDGEGCDHQITPEDILWEEISPEQIESWQLGDSLLATPSYVREISAGVTTMGDGAPDPGV